VPATPERFVMVQFRQTSEPPKEWDCAVLSENWRLVNGAMLFDIRTDPGQRKDIAAQHPEIVQKLRTAHDRYWAEVSPTFSDYCRIVIGHESENPARLTCFDWHTTTPWNQRQILQGLQANSFWAVRVALDGDYEFALRRWPEEVNQPITAPLPGTPPGVAIRATHVRLKIAGIDQTQPVPSDACAVTFRFRLKAGSATLQTWLLDGQEPPDRARGAYYVHVQRK
jgi:hypothetical protein